ncbi:MAG TPA: ABC transporter permease [Actinomycetota bacterium]|nr:ABC transporter permease [Actinomycetota bacterium]
MRGLILRRALQAFLTLLLVTLVIHGALALLPGEPMRGVFGPRRPDPEVFDALRKMYHLDLPWPLRYLNYLQDLFTGDWGNTLPGDVRGAAYVGPPVTTVVSAAVPSSIRLLLPALIIQVGAGILGGIYAVRRRRERSGVALYTAAVLLLGIPVVVVAYWLQMVFAWNLDWFPTIGLTGWRAYVLPVLSLALVTTPLTILFTRSQLQDVLLSGFVKPARARAIPEQRIVGVHALRASLGPVATFVAATFGQLLTALVIVETIFRIPGYGHLVYDSLLARDRTLLIALVVLSTAAVLVMNFIADMIHIAADPRVREQVATKTA